MIKKDLVGIMFAIIGGTAMIPFSLFAAKGSEMPGVSVYGTKAEQDTVYEAVQNPGGLNAFLDNNKITIIKESITPVYVASLYEYAETGVFTIRPETRRDNEIAYRAKTVTANGAFAGNMKFYVLDGVAYMSSFTPNRVPGFSFEPSYGFEGNESLVSYSYADHAKRVQSLTGRESFVPVSKVRYVGVEGLGNVFYVNDGKTEALVYIDGDGGVFSQGPGEIVYVGKELKKAANEKLAERKASLKRKAEWEAANPGKAWSFTGSGGAAAASGISGQVDDVVNIVEYLGLEDTDAYFTSTAVTVASATPNIARDVKKSVESRKKSSNATNATIGYGLPKKETFTPPTTIAIPIAAFVLYIGIKLIFISKKRKIKKTESTDSQSNDN
jgi:hypothetical protein